METQTRVRRGVVEAMTPIEKAGSTGAKLGIKLSNSDEWVSLFEWPNKSGERADELLKARLGDIKLGDEVEVHESQRISGDRVFWNCYRIIQKKKEEQKREKVTIDRESVSKFMKEFTEFREAVGDDNDFTNLELICLFYIFLRSEER